MHGELTAWLTLPGGRRVRARVAVIEDPTIPTPLEPEVARLPMVHEWPEIVARLARMDFESIETDAR